ncbi:MAG: hypothetical protein HQM15_09130 [Deltaproteobacteria bacterium]|nr:hypothetical protein [Deltaproteobacteria bacterium]
MIIEWSSPFKKDFKKLPQKIQELFAEKMHLATDSRLTHPSLRIKKMQGHPYIWEASVTMNYRFTFHKTELGIFLRRIGTHDMLKNP